MSGKNRKQVYVIRHARAVGKDLDIPDFERSLTTSGINDSKRLGREMARLGLRSFLLISSPARRALEMAHIVAKELGKAPKKVRVAEPVYHGTDGAAFIDVLREVDDKFTTVLLFGHEPSLSQFIRRLCGVFEKPLPKTGVVGVEFPIANWATVGDITGSLFYFDFPMSKKENRRLQKSLTKQIELSLEESMAAAIGRYSPEASDRMTKVIRSSGKEAARRLIKVAGSRELLRRHLATLAGQPAEVAPDPEQVGGALPPSADTDNNDT